MHWMYVCPIAVRSFTTLLSLLLIGAALVASPLGASTSKPGATLEPGTETAALPDPWTTDDIGNPTPAGNARYAGDTFTLEGGGASIGGTADQFRFVYQMLDGNGQIVARLDRLDRTHVWTKAGVMLREELTGTSRHAFAYVSAGHGAGFERRLRDATTSSDNPTRSDAAPLWLKLKRTGDRFTAFTSHDGSRWRQIGSDVIDMNTVLYVGLAVSSRTTRELATASFMHVGVTPCDESGPEPDPEIPNVPPNVVITSPASNTVFTAPESIPLAAEANDLDGRVSQVDFYVAGALVASDPKSPYSSSWNATTAGTYAITVMAKDDRGAWTTSAPVSISVKEGTNEPPAVSLTSPANGSTFEAPANITVAANAPDPDGSVSRMDFYAGSALIASDTSAPYSAAWSGVPAGVYSLTAVARDNGGAIATSAAISITVAEAESLPRYVVFNASADHDTNVASYRVEFFPAGVDPASATPVQSVEIGKPTPVNGEISGDVLAAIEALASGTYVATVAATGPGGSSRSAPSEPFQR